MRASSRAVYVWAPVTEPALDTLASLATIAAVIAPVFVVVSVGVFWGFAKFSFDNSFVSTFVVGVATPCLVFTSLTRTGASVTELGHLALAVVACILSNMGVGYVITRVLNLSQKTFLPCFAFPNSGNLGLPMVLFAFGDGAAAYAVVFFTVCSIIQFGFGPALATGKVNIVDLARTPLLHAVWISLVVTGFSYVPPDWVGKTTKLLGDCAIPLMLVALGVALAKLRLSRQDSLRIFGLSFLRSSTGFAVAYLVAGAFGLEGVERGCLILQNSMPIAIFNYMYALRYNNDHQAVAGMVVASTLLSLVTIPLVLWYVMGL